MQWPLALLARKLERPGWCASAAPIRKPCLPRGSAWLQDPQIIWADWDYLRPLRPLCRFLPRSRMSVGLVFMLHLLDRG